MVSIPLRRGQGYRVVSKEPDPKDQFASIKGRIAHDCRGLAEEWSAQEIEKIITSTSRQLDKGELDPAVAVQKWGEIRLLKNFPRHLEKVEREGLLAGKRFADLTG